LIFLIELIGFLSGCLNRKNILLVFNFNWLFFLLYGN